MCVCVCVCVCVGGGGAGGSGLLFKFQKGEVGVFRLLTYLISCDR